MSSDPWGLSPRQVQVLTLVADGCTNAEVANSLGVSTQTVKNHMYAIFNQMGARNRVEAVMAALEAGLLSCAAEAIR